MVKGNTKFNVHSKNHISTKHVKNYFVFNLLAFSIIIIALIGLGWTASKMHMPIIQLTEVNLNPFNLFFYSIRTVTRLLIALIFSIIFALLYGTLAAKNKSAEQILIPLLDILQSVPILGYISFTVTAFLNLFPDSTLGLECAAIFAIFTSQAWNIAFSFYQSMKTVPSELQEAAYIFKMNSWQKFWRLEVPFALPNLIWNAVISMSGAWFFVVASEVINVGANNIKLPGIGSYIALALADKNLLAIIYAITAMSLTILVYNQLIINPCLAWAERFRADNNKSTTSADSWLLNLFNKKLVINKLFLPLKYIGNFLLYLPLPRKKNYSVKCKTAKNNYFKQIIVFSISLYICYSIYKFLQNDITWKEVMNVAMLACFTMLRVVVLIILASMIWVPVGIYIGLRPKLTKFIDPLIQFLASFPVNLLFPVVVVTITKYNLNPNIWLSFLMIMGAQWYILFNVISGTASIPNELKEAAANLNLNSWLYLKKLVLPAIAPYFITGAITASGGAWNASIVAEWVGFGDQIIYAQGLGSYINMMTIKADFPKIVLGVGMMSLFVVVFNHFFWQPLYNYATKRFQIS